MSTENSGIAAATTVASNGQTPVEGRLVRKPKIKIARVDADPDLIRLFRNDCARRGIVLPPQRFSVAKHIARVSALKAQMKELAETFRGTAASPDLEKLVEQAKHLRCHFAVRQRMPKSFNLSVSFSHEATGAFRIAEFFGDG